jgi:orotidine-5'-phosphate decarboxylase
MPRFIDKLSQAWKQNDSLVCVGLDPEMSRLPLHLQQVDEPYFDFCRAIVDATADQVCAFKPQAAHFAAVGRESELARLCAYISQQHPSIVLILDAKRGDVGSTAAFYAQEAYVRFGADAVTVSPYLGEDSVTPYLDYADKGIVVLCRTSNPDSDWLQCAPEDAVPVYQRVARRVASWNSNGQFMLVTGATYPEELGEVRKLVGDLPLLVPGVGAQGGDLARVLENGLTAAGAGLVISSSRGILYAQDGMEFADGARSAAQALKGSINEYR